MTWMGWQLPATRSTTLGTADVPTVSSSGCGDQLHQVAQSAELPEARAGRPSRAAAARRHCGIPRPGQRANPPVGLYPEGRHVSSYVYIDIYEAHSSTPPRELVGGATPPTVSARPTSTRFSTKPLLVSDLSPLDHRDHASMPYRSGGSASLAKGGLVPCLK